MQPSGGSIASGSVAALPAALVTFAGQQSAANTVDLSIGAAASVGFAGASIASGICQINAAAILVGANTAGSISKLGDDGELVVDTIGLNDKTFVDSYRTPHTTKMHVVERFKMLEGGKILQASITVDDPGAFNMPWSAIQRWKRREGDTLTELICAENHTDFFHNETEAGPIPQAEKPDF